MALKSAQTNPNDDTTWVIFGLLGTFVLLHLRWTWRALKFLGTAIRQSYWVMRALPQFVVILFLLAVGLMLCGAWLTATIPTTALMGVLTLPTASPRRWNTVRDSVQAHWYRTQWEALAIQTGIVTRDRLVYPKNPGTHMTEKWIVPQLKKVRMAAGKATLSIRLVPGLTKTHIEEGLPTLAAAGGAYSTSLTATGPQSYDIVLVHRDELQHVNVVTAGTMNRPKTIGTIRLGRTVTGEKWHLNLAGAHTLVAGCSGSGKGSVLWGVCCGLAPEVARGTVELWGIDLKRGVELSMAENLFAVRAYNTQRALETLRALVDVIDLRAGTMVGHSRSHTPTTDAPLYVLVIDELAALTAYADKDTRTEAARLLAVILSQGRAFGVIAFACLQDPRKEAIPMRSLFTQTIALRLRSDSETDMVLGAGMKTIAPAHHISRDQPGVGYMVSDTGAVVHGRADYWPDELLRYTAHRYGSVENTTKTDPLQTAAHHNSSKTQAENNSKETPKAKPERTARKPRKPRTPRTDKT